MQHQQTSEITCSKSFNLCTDASLSTVNNISSEKAAELNNIKQSSIDAILSLKKYDIVSALKGVLSKKISGEILVKSESIKIKKNVLLGIDWNPCVIAKSKGWIESFKSVVMGNRDVEVQISLLELMLYCVYSGVTDFKSTNTLLEQYLTIEQISKGFEVFSHSKYFMCNNALFGSGGTTKDKSNVPQSKMDLAKLMYLDRVKGTSVDNDDEFPVYSDDDGVICSDYDWVDENMDVPNSMLCNPEVHQKKGDYNISC